MISIEERIKELKTEKSIYSSIETDLVFAIEWMETGRKPGSMRGAERRAAYEKTILFDPQQVQIAATEIQEVDESILDQLNEQVDDTLWFLTKREREICMLHYGYDFSEDYISQILSI
jgi:positive control factor